MATKSVNIQYSCRLCCSSEGRSLRNIFDPPYKENQLSAKIFYCVSIQINENEHFLSKFVCDECLNKLELFYNFKVNCVAANNKFMIRRKQWEMSKSYPTSNVIKEESGEEVESLVPFEMVLCQLKEEQEDDQDINEDVFVSTNSCDSNSDKIPLEPQRKKKKTSIRKHDCNSCDRKFRSPAELREHMKIRHSETIENPFVCNICNRSFLFERRLRLHTKTIHEKVCNFICDFCGKGYVQKYRLTHHMLNSHTREQNYQCSICSIKFVNKLTLKSHIKNKHEAPKFECETCQKKFTTKKTLNLHQVTHINIEEREKFYCHICSSSFLSKKRYQMHIKSHTGELVFKCHLCDKRFTTKSSLNSHLVIHSGVKNFVCDVCGKAFAERKNLMVHNRIHTGEKPYQCNFCLKEFNQKSSYNTHVRKNSCKMRRNNS